MSTETTLLDQRLRTEMQFATGRGKDEKNWKNQTLPLGGLIRNLVGKHIVGPKDGLSITQGPLVAPARTAKNVAANYMIMVDVDTGADMESVQKFARDNELFAVIWTTHSHMKAQTLVPEQKLITWMRQNKRHWDPQDEDIRAYFMQTAKMAPKIAKTCRLEGKQHLEGGIKYVVAHDPMPRFRVLFPLARPFSFSEDGTQQQRIDKWKELYAKFSDMLGVGWDRSCVDPSRLMYTPRCNAGDESNHEVLILDGEFLDLDIVDASEVDMDAALPGDDMDAMEAAAAMWEAEQQRDNTFVTPGLLRFVAQHGATFAAADMMEFYNPDGIRRVIDGGFDFRCPNADAHSNGDTDEDTGFMVKNGEENNVGSGFYMGCMHDTCKGASNGDRIWYLDKFCQTYNLGVNELLAFCPEHVEAVEAAAAQQNAADTLRDRIMLAVTPDDREALLKEMAQLSLVAAAAPKISLLVADAEVRTKLGAPSVAGFKELFANFKRAAREEWQRTAGETNQLDHVEAIPDDPSKARAIWREWAHDDKVRVLKAVFKKWNAKKQRVFINTANEAVRVEITPTSVLFKRMTADAWVAVLSEAAKFKLIDGRSQLEREVAPFAELVTIFNGDPSELDLPRVEGVSQVPVFGADGTLVVKNGYDAANRVYIHCPFDIRPVSAVPSEEEIEEAVSWLLDEAIRDFPFSDSFNGDDVMPTYIDKAPNWERGKTSRLHAMMMILQPFARNLIPGNAPAFHIDKATRGTGASYLANVPSIILTGREAVASSLPNETRNGGEETRKKITSALMRGAPIIFWDNVNHKVDSADLALVLTAGIWSDRVLGGNEQFEIPVRNLWLIAGNNVSFSDEMYRRLVPIRLDANRSDPENRDPDEFKHNPLGAWLMSARRDLVWACHTLVQNWIAKGRPTGSGTIASYETWAGTMTGILEAAGLAGGLSTLGGYRAIANEDQGEEQSLVAWWWEHYQENIVTTAELFNRLTSPGSDGGLTGQSGVASSMGLDARNEGSGIRVLGHHLRKHIVGKTVKIDETRTVKVMKLATSPARYRLISI